MLLLLAVKILSAQAPACFRYDENSGFNSSEVYDLLQDRRGFIWIATDRGVFRFDGYTFEPFTTAQGLTDNTVFCIEEDYAGRIWAMPFNGKLCYIQDDKVICYRYNDTLEKYLPGARIARSMHVLPMGALQIGYLTQGIVELSADGTLRKMTNNIPGANRQYCAIQQDNHLLVGTDGYSYLRSSLLFTIRSDSLVSSSPIKGKPLRENIRGIQRKTGSWCFAVGAYLIEVDKAGNLQYTIMPAEPLCLYEDKEQCLWVGFDLGKGVRRYASLELCSAGHFEDFYQGETVTDVIQDREGAFWISTLYNGLIYCPDIAVRSWQLAGDENEKALAFMEYQYGIIFSLWRNHGVAAMRNDTLMAFAGMPHERGAVFKTMAWDDYTNELILGGNNKTYSYDVKTQRCTAAHWMGSNSITVTPKGRYLGCAWNLGFWSHENPHDSTIMLGNPSVRIRPDVLYKDCKCQIWMGGLNGLYLVQDSVLTSCSAMHPLLNNRISGICELKDSTLVVATQSNGIVFIRNGVAQEMEHSSDVMFDHIAGITPGDSNTFWISARSGLYKTSVVHGTCTLRCFAGLKEVIGDGGSCYYSAPAKKLWLTNNNSIIGFDPSLYHTGNTGPPVFIRSVSTNDSILSLTNKPELEYSSNFLHIVFSGLAYRMKGNLLYRYRLAGQDSTWKYTRQHSVDIAGLQAGDYRFEVEALNESGAWSSSPAVYAFFLRPPFWETAWFRLSALLLALLFFWGAVALRYRIKRKRDLLRDQALMYRQQALSSQMNPHFLFNALATIQTFVLKEDKRKALEAFSSFASLLRKSLEHSGERYISLEEEIKTLILYFDLEKLRFGERLKYAVIVGPELDPAFSQVPAMLVQPMVENAIQHGVCMRSEGGTVHVRFFMKGDELWCEVDDDGVGRAVAERASKTGRKRSGVKITEDRLRVLSEINRSVFSFEIIDKEFLFPPSSGTLVRFIIPCVAKKHHHEKTESADR